MFFLHARFPLRLDCESWDGAPSLDLGGFLADEGLEDVVGVVGLISSGQAQLLRAWKGSGLYNPTTLSSN